jgi:hypothetical protein
MRPARQSGERVVRRPQISGTIIYVFEATIGIHSALSFSSGDVSQLLTNALFDLDEEGRLFPGITDPEDRLRMVGMHPIGYERSVRDTRSEDETLDPTRLPKEKQELRVRLEEAGEALDAVMLRQRMLGAKLNALFNRCHYRTPLSAEDKQKAETLLAAAEAITSSAQAALEPVL